MPGLTLHTSNRLERLADRLGAVTREPLASVFASEIVVVQSLGMARWLKLELARRHGVCANVRFPFPKAFEREVCAAVLPQATVEPLFEAATMQWTILKLLPSLLTEPAFAELQHYLDGDTDARKPIQLASRIASLFDQYLIYRSDWLLAWEQGRESHWQAMLWRQLARLALRPHPAALRQLLEEKLRATNSRLVALPERVSIFGIASLPPFHVELFASLARHLDVHLFLLQPCQEWWGEIVSPRREEREVRRLGARATELHLERGHRLLASMGRTGQDFLQLVFQLENIAHAEDFAAPGEATLLACLQSDVLQLHDRGAQGEPKTVMVADDDSVQVHSCHSPLREMEVLHDHLLDWFARDPALAPRDVLVMMPDLETYAPFVEAVFSTPEDERQRIPFSLADRAQNRRSALIETFLALLAVPGSRLGVASVLALLDAPVVHRRFGLVENDLPRIREWVEQTNIRWGKDAAHRARFGVPEIAGNTWRDGLDRLLLGYAMAGRERQLFENILPHDVIEGDAAHTLGQFVEFAERLFAIATALEKSRRLDEWAEELRAVFEQFFQPDEASEHEAQLIRDVLTDLARQQRLSGFSERVELSVVLEQLTPALAEDRSGAGYLTGGVTFCALKPMRSIPFKIICLVGMSDGAFPRPASQLGFDLMAQQPRAGDHSPREDDRYLFLETLLSARDRLYLSYVGQSVRDHREAPPSVLVSELLDGIAQGFRHAEEAGDLIRDQVLTRHRLQAFSEAYFNGARLFSYSQENCAAALAIRNRSGEPKAFANAPLAEPEPEWREVELERLAEFFSNPAKFFLTRRLGLKLPDEQTALEEREPFEIAGLDAYSLRQDLLEMKLAGTSTAAAHALVAAAGRLPLGETGTTRFRSLSTEVENFHARLAPHLSAGQMEPILFDCKIGEFHLTGQFHNFSTAGLLHYRCSSIKAKDALRLWIHHLAWNLAAPAGHALTSRLLGTDESRVYQPIPNAAAQLEKLLELYWHGLRTPLKFFPESSRAFVEAESNPRVRKSPQAKALEKWEAPEFGSGRGESEDAFVELCFRDTTPLDDEFEEVARTVFGPLLQHESQA